MIEIGKENEVKFKVHVDGTSSIPLVKVIVVDKDCELGFNAEKVGDEWKAILNLPSSMLPGEYSFRVDVILNGKLFSPIKKIITIGKLENIILPVEPMVKVNNIEEKSTHLMMQVVEATTPVIKIAPLKEPRSIQPKVPVTLVKGEVVFE